jgi:YidC/Oxa1 family membrane protein insertase
MEVLKPLGDLFNLILLAPTINLIVFILRVLQASNVPGALGFSIITLTVLINAVTWPFRSAQMRATRHTQTKMAQIKPKLAELKIKHKDDKIAFAQAQNQLFKENGINPSAGCLPSLIPILLIIPLYQVIFAFFNGLSGLDKINHFLYTFVPHLTTLPDTHFFGVNLIDKPSDFGKVGILVLLVPIITAVLQFVLSKMMAPQGVPINKEDKPKEVKQKVEEEDMATQMQGQMLVMMPLMIGFFAFQFPIGLALYWNVLSIMGIAQQYLITGWGGLEPWLKKIKS